MKLSEISRIPIKDENPELSEHPNIPNLKNIVKNYHGYKLNGGNVGNEFYLELVNNNNEIVGWFVYQLINVSGQEYANDTRVVVDKKYRGKGIASIFYHYLINQLKKSVLSDQRVTKDGERLYKSLIKTHVFKTKIINIVTKEIEEFSFDKWDKVFVNSREPSDYRLIFETVSPLPPFPIHLISEAFIIHDGP